VPDDPEDTVSITPIRAEPAPRGPKSHGGEGCLVEIYGQELGRRIPLTGGVFEIGRSSKCDLTIDQDSVSRHHARIARSRDGRYSVADLGSTNGTTLDGTRLNTRPVRFTPGALLRIGESALRVYKAARVDMLIWFMVRDDPNPNGWQSGLLTSNGAKKPSFAAFMRVAAATTSR